MKRGSSHPIFVTIGAILAVFLFVLILIFLYRGDLGKLQKILPDFNSSESLETFGIVRYGIYDNGLEFSEGRKFYPFTKERAFGEIVLSPDELKEAFRKKIIDAPPATLKIKGDDYSFEGFSSYSAIAHLRVGGEESITGGNVYRPVAYKKSGTEFFYYSVDEDGNLVRGSVTYGFEKLQKEQEGEQDFFRIDVSDSTKSDLLREKLVLPKIVEKSLKKLSVKKIPVFFRVNSEGVYEIDKNYSLKVLEQSQHNLLPKKVHSAVSSGEVFQGDGVLIELVYSIKENSADKNSNYPPIFLLEGRNSVYYLAFPVMDVSTERKVSNEDILNAFNIWKFSSFTTPMEIPYKKIKTHKEGTMKFCVEVVDRNYFVIDLAKPVDGNSCELPLDLQGDPQKIRYDLSYGGMEMFDGIYWHKLKDVFEIDGHAVFTDDVKSALLSFYFRKLKGKTNFNLDLSEDDSFQREIIEWYKKSTYGFFGGNNVYDTCLNGRGKFEVRIVDFNPEIIGEVFGEKSPSSVLGKFYLSSDNHLEFNKIDKNCELEEDKTSIEGNSVFWRTVGERMKAWKEDGFPAKINIESNGNSYEGCLKLEGRYLVFDLVNGGCNG